MDSAPTEYLACYAQNVVSFHAGRTHISFPMNLATALLNRQDHESGQQAAGSSKHKE